jgi:SOS-response transcriptional repressor LexA
MNRKSTKLQQLASQHNLNDFSLREIGRMMNPDDPENPQTVKYHWNKLYEAGKINYLPRTRETRKSIRNYVDDKVLGDGRTLVSIPVRGMANCGPASLYADDENIGYIHVSSRFLKTNRYNDLYAIIASGESMNRTKINGKPINDGDYVVVDRSVSQPNNGDCVVAIVNGLANIKRFLREHGRIVLVSESSEHFDPIFIHPEDQDEALIAGKVVQVVQKPKFA